MLLVLLFFFFFFFLKYQYFHQTKIRVKPEYRELNGMKDEQVSVVYPGRVDAGGPQAHQHVNKATRKGYSVGLPEEKVNLS